MSRDTNLISEYIKKFPINVQEILKGMQDTIKSVAPEAQECISYGMPTFKLNGKNLVHFAGYKSHIGFYPTPSAIQKFQAELRSFKSSKGAIQFPINRPIPFDLVKRITLFRTGELGSTNY